MVRRASRQFAHSHKPSTPATPGVEHAAARVRRRCPPGCRSLTWRRSDVAKARADSFAASVALAQQAEELGYERVWYAEHHNMPSIASSATSVLIAHIGAHTQHIRLGAGGVMLPNHAPLLIAEQFGTLAAMYPDRIDLGLGRAPGSDQNTMYALRRNPASAEAFPQDVLELQGYLAGDSVVPGVDAVPGKGSRVPLYILGSSLFGAKLAAALGLPVRVRVALRTSGAGCGDRRLPK